MCPSLPGYGFSDRPATSGWGVERIAAAWSALMARLGYDRYGAAGSDWGTSITASLGLQDPRHVAGIHLVPPLAAPDPATLGALTDAERAALADLDAARAAGSGYTEQQATAPQTIGYALVDSPAALCAWIVERFWAWCDFDDAPRRGARRRRPARQRDAVLAARRQAPRRRASTGRASATSRRSSRGRTPT